MQSHRQTFDIGIGQGRAVADQGVAQLDRAIDDLAPHVGADAIGKRHLLDDRPVLDHRDPGPPIPRTLAQATRSDEQVRHHRHRVDTRYPRPKLALGGVGLVEPCEHIVDEFLVAFVDEEISVAVECMADPRPAEPTQQATVLLLVEVGEFVDHGRQSQIERRHRDDLGLGNDLIDQVLVDLADKQRCTLPTMGHVAVGQHAVEDRAPLSGPFVELVRQLIVVAVAHFVDVERRRRRGRHAALDTFNDSGIELAATLEAPHGVAGVAVRIRCRGHLAIMVGWRPQNNLADKSRPFATDPIVSPWRPEHMRHTSRPGVDMSQSPDRNLALELVRVTESGAMAASRWMGRGDKDGADGAAVKAMRLMLNSVAMDGTVIIGEGEKDEAPMLYNGEHLGNGFGPKVDVAVDPIDGTTLTAYGRANALSVIAVSDAGTMFNPGPFVYMEKIAVGPECAGAIDLDASVTENLHRIAGAKRDRIKNLTCVVLDRPRHESIIAEIREAGARIRLIPDGDVAGAISTAWPDAGADVLFGIGGTPEGVISAAALKCMGGEIQGRLWPRNDEERRLAEEMGIDVSRKLMTDDLVAGNNCFFAATGITEGDLLKGVRFDASGATTQSLVMRSRSGTVRQINATHRLDKLDDFAIVDYT